MISDEKLESSLRSVGYILRKYGSVRTWRSSSEAQGHRSKKARKSLFAQCKTLIDDNSSSIEDRAMKSACSMGLLDRAD